MATAYHCSLCEDRSTPFHSLPSSGPRKPFCPACGRVLLPSSAEPLTWEKPISSDWSRAHSFRGRPTKPVVPTLTYVWFRLQALGSTAVETVRSFLSGN